MHPNFVDYDPCYNPNLTQDKGDCSLNLNEKLLPAKCKEIEYKAIKICDDNSVHYSIDSVFEGTEQVIIKGWIYDKNINTQKESPQIIVLDKKYKKCYAFTTEKEYRQDLSAVHLGKGSVFAGFKCVIEEKLDKECFKELYIKYGEKMIKIKSL